MQNTDSFISAMDAALIQQALDSSAIVAHTDRHGIIIYANQKFCEISGYNIDELLGQNHRILNSGTHDEDFFPSMWSQISQGLKWEGEICNRRKDGNLYWVHTVIIPFLDGNKEIKEYVSIRWDITEKKKTQKRLAEAKENLQSLVDAIFQGLLIYDLNGEILWCNDTAAQMFSSATENVKVGKKLESILGSQFNLFKTGVQTIQSDSQIFETITKPYIFKQHTAYLVGVQDVTERTNSEALILQQDRMASVGILASGLAHEIGTPLGVIRGRAEMLTMGGFPEESVKNQSQIIIQQIDRVSALIQSLLKLARGSEVENPVLVNVSSLLKDVLEFLNFEFRKNNIQIKVSVPEELQIRAVYTSLFQVFLNLLVNSTHAIQDQKKSNSDLDGLIEITASESGGKVLITFRDNGVGISESNKTKLFTPFFTTKEIGKGTGLGLATSYKILQTWGARIDVRSKPGAGAEFELTFVRN